MADKDNRSDQEFDNIIDELVRERELGLRDDNQSDISTDQWRLLHKRSKMIFNPMVNF